MELTSLVDVLSGPTAVWAKGSVKDKFVFIGTAARLSERLVKESADFNVVVASASAGRINVRLADFNAADWAKPKA